MGGGCWRCSGQKKGREGSGAGRRLGQQSFAPPDPKLCVRPPNLTWDLSTLEGLLNLNSPVAGLVPLPGGMAKCSLPPRAMGGCTVCTGGSSSLFSTSLLVR